MNSTPQSVFPAIAASASSRLSGTPWRGSPATLLTASAVLLCCVASIASPRYATPRKSWAAASVFPPARPSTAMGTSMSPMPATTL